MDELCATGRGRLRANGRRHSVVPQRLQAVAGIAPSRNDGQNAVVGADRSNLLEYNQ
jgi:hypothetical protein